ncbi:MAG: 8-amino-7-oxononanoate synthase [Thermoguttaceae bacterium]|nr:8-amino-7-oxononanoate synthase [Thermoguttaceae bacterium]
MATASEYPRRPHPLEWVEEELCRLESSGLRRFRRLRSTRQGAIITLDGRAVINFGSNDYLGLSTHPEVIAAAFAAAKEFGWGSGASALVCGYTSIHQQLEADLARFHQTEAALVFGSGYAANVGTVTSLVGPGDVVYMDSRNHASLWDGCRLSRADIRLFDHHDLTTLHKELQKRGRYRRALVVTDAVFSIEGDLAPLEGLVRLCREYEAILLVDEAHAVGIFGPQGEGLSAELALHGEVSLRIGTLSKALGSVGGYLVGPQKVIDLVISKARSLIFSTASPPAAAAAARKALELLRANPSSGRELLRRAEKLRQHLTSAGWKLSPSCSQIISIILGEPDRALTLTEMLLTEGIFCPAMRPPTVPEGHSCLRISLTLAHTEAMLEKLTLALGQCGAKN